MSRIISIDRYYKYVLSEEGVLVIQTHSHQNIATYHRVIELAYPYLLTADGLYDIKIPLMPKCLVQRHHYPIVGQASWIYDKTVVFKTRIANIIKKERYPYQLGEIVNLIEICYVICDDKVQTLLRDVIPHSKGYLIDQGSNIIDEGGNIITTKNPNLQLVAMIDKEFIYSNNVPHHLELVKNNHVLSRCRSIISVPQTNCIYFIDDTERLICYNGEVMTVIADGIVAAQKTGTILILTSHDGDFSTISLTIPTSFTKILSVNNAGVYYDILIVTK